MNREELYSAAREKWGLEEQLIVAIEELSELQKELCKYLRGKGNNAHIAEELADVEIVVEQVKQFLALNTKVGWMKLGKLQRLENLVKETEEENAGSES